MLASKNARKLTRDGCVFFGGCLRVFLAEIFLQKYSSIDLIKKNDSCSTWALCPASKNFFKWVRVGLPTDIAPSVRTCFQSGQHQAGATTLWPWRPCAPWGAGLRGEGDFSSSGPIPMPTRSPGEHGKDSPGNLADIFRSASHQCVMSQTWSLGWPRGLGDDTQLLWGQQRFVGFESMGIRWGESLESPRFAASLLWSMVALMCGWRLGVVLSTGKECDTLWTLLGPLLTVKRFSDSAEWLCKHCCFRTASFLDLEMKIFYQFQRWATSLSVSSYLLDTPCQTFLLPQVTSSNFELIVGPHQPHCILSTWNLLGWVFQGWCEMMWWTLIFRTAAILNNMTDISKSKRYKV